MASQPPNPTSLRPKLTIIPLHDTGSQPTATPLQVKHAVAKAKGATGHDPISQATASASNDAASTNPATVDDPVPAASRADNVPLATTMETVQEQIKSERRERQRELRKIRVEKEKVARAEKWKRDMEAPIIRKDRWGRKSQLEMAKRKEMRALEKELERLEAEKEARRQERREKRRLEEEGTLVE